MYDELNKLVCAREDAETLDEAIAYAFDLAWLSGGKPILEYEEQTWESDCPLEQAVKEYTNRIASGYELKSQDEKKIRDFLESVAVDGTVHETSITSIAAMYWQV